MSKLNSTTAAAALVELSAQTPVAPKEPSKMELARPIFVEVTDVEYELAEGKSARSMFISRAVTEVGLTEKGAATYWQNLSNAARGLPLYGKKKAAVEQGAKETVAAAADAQDAADAQAADEVDVNVPADESAVEPGADVPAVETGDEYSVH